MKTKMVRITTSIMWQSLKIQAKGRHPKLILNDPSETRHMRSRLWQAGRKRRLSLGRFRVPSKRNSSDEGYSGLIIIYHCHQPIRLVILIIKRQSYNIKHVFIRKRSETTCTIRWRWFCTEPAAAMGPRWWTPRNWWWSPLKSGMGRTASRRTTADVQ